MIFPRRCGIGLVTGAVLGVDASAGDEAEEDEELAAAATLAAAVCFVAGALVPLGNLRILLVGPLEAVPLAEGAAVAAEPVEPSFNILDKGPITIFGAMLVVSEIVTSAGTDDVTGAEVAGTEVVISTGPDAVAGAKVVEMETEVEDDEGAKTPALILSPLKSSSPGAEVVGTEVVTSAGADAVSGAKEVEMETEVEETAGTIGVETTEGGKSVASILIVSSSLRSSSSSSAVILISSLSSSSKSESLRGKSGTC